MARETATLSYRDMGRGPKPYLVIRLELVRGGPVVGLLDSGADCTALPIGYASLLGYEAKDLEEHQVSFAAGEGTALQATRPCRGSLVSLPETFEVWPSFLSAALFPLWGRRDVFAALAPVAFDEGAQEFSISVPS